MKRQLLAGVLAAVAAVLWGVSPAWACPFCTAVSQTFSEEINTMDVAVIARLVKGPPASDKPGDEIAKATFEVAQVIKGEGLVKPGEKIETLYFGDGAPGKSFLVMGIDPPKVMWSTPLPLSERAQTYLTSILKLPKDGPEPPVATRGFVPRKANPIMPTRRYDPRPHSAVFLEEVEVKEMPPDATGIILLRLAQGWSKKMP